MKISRAFSLAPLVILWLSLTGSAHAGEDPVYTRFLSNVAVGGYDVTAYFTEGRPVEGDKQFSTEYLGADWHFASRENLEKFSANPEQYAPQYGGYCAWAVAQGDLASGDPQQWDIHEGRLYLNYNGEIRDRWLADKQNFITKGDTHWPAIVE